MSRRSRDPGMPLSQQDLYQTFQQTLQILLDDIVPRVQRLLGPWHCLVFTRRKSLPQIEIFHNGRTPGAKLTLEDDDRVTLSGPDGQQYPDLWERHWRMYLNLREDVAANLIHLLLHHPRTGLTLPALLAHQGLGDHLQSLIVNRAEDIIRTTAMQAAMPAGPAVLNPTTFHKEYLRLLRTHLTEPRRRGPDIPPPQSLRERTRSPRRKLPITPDLHRGKSFQQVPDPNRDMPSMVQWAPVEHRQDGQAVTLRAIVDPDGRALFQLDRRSNGTIQVLHHGTPMDTHPTAPRDQLTPALLDHTAATLLRTLIDRNPVDTCRTLANQQSASLLRKDLRRTARRLLPHMKAPSVLSTRTQGDPTLTTAASIANTIIRKHILDPRVADLATQLFASQDPHDPPHHPYTVTQYNITLLNQAILQELRETNPTALAYYCHRVLPNDNPLRPTTFRHPGQLVARVRQHTGLTGAQWRRFLRIQPLCYTDTGDLAQACQALVDANHHPRNPGPEQQARAQQVFDQDQQHRRFADRQWSHGTSWNALCQVYNRFLAHPGPTPTLPVLDRVVDALNGHIQEDLPWGPGSWDNLVARSNRWHLRIRTPRNQTPPPPPAHWHSHILEATLEGFTFRAVTNSQDLADTGYAMGNCLSTYWQTCQAGNARIFTAHADGRLQAAVELVPSQGTWRTSQMEAPQRGPLPPAIPRAAAALARTYQEAQDRRDREDEPEAP